MAKKSSLKIKCHSLNSELPCFWIVLLGMLGEVGQEWSPDLALIYFPSLTADIFEPGPVSSPLEGYKEQIQPSLLQAGWSRRGAGLKSKSSPSVVWVQEGQVLAVWVPSFKPSFLLPTKPTQITPDSPSFQTSSCLSLVFKPLILLVLLLFC